MARRSSKGVVATLGERRNPVGSLVEALSEGSEMMRIYRIEHYQISQYVIIVALVRQEALLGPESIYCYVLCKPGARFI